MHYIYRTYQRLVHLGILLCLITSSNQPLVGQPLPINTTEQASCIHQINTQLDQYFDIISAQILSMLDTITQHMDYWKSEQTKSFASTLLKNPTLLILGRSYQQEVRRHIVFLQEQQNKHFEYLGEISRARYMPSITFADIETIIDTTYDSLKLPRDKPIGKPADPAQLHKKILRYSMHAQNYHYFAASRLHTHAKPNHLYRNWGKYLIGSTAALAAGYYCKNNYNDLQELCTKTIPNSAVNYWKNEIKDPLQRLYTEYFDPKNSTVSVPKDAQQQHTKANQTAVANYLKNNKVDFTPNMAQSIEVGLVPDILHELQNKRFNASFINTPAMWDLLQNILIQLNIEVTRTYRFYDIFDRFSNKVLILPVGVYTYLLWQIIKSGRNMLKKESLIRPMQTALFEISKILNDYDNPELEYSDQAHGHVHYLAYTMQKQIEYVPVEFKESFNEDIARITAEQFSIAQKLGTVKRMFKEYPFLRVTVS